MLTSDPHLKLFLFFFFLCDWCISLFFIFTLEPSPHIFYTVCSVTDTPHTDCFQHPLGRGSDPHLVSLSYIVSVCVRHLLLSCCSFLFPALSFPVPFFPSLLHDCMCIRRALLLPLGVCMETLGRRTAVHAGKKCIKNAALKLLDLKISRFLYRACTQKTTVTPQWGG